MGNRLSRKSIGFLRPFHLCVLLGFHCPIGLTRGEEIEILNPSGEINNGVGGTAISELRIVVDQLSCLGLIDLKTFENRFFLVVVALNKSIAAYIVLAYNLRRVKSNVVDPS